ncbi:putative oxidoreductase [Actinacidiphila reveromycinica]|uniref:Putative oxidoreductase n=1 Tax=Actinacidiphila reveromycinica TaxID=659352 RepID=A0A7U3UMX4_9ACTN|nr:FAD-linked oxidase C-terminal domain-containing protein [Streptomyces sp. SN-593]BBA95489.1 putative oxidoreductase [Streptomyces sp. SN-593]
MTTEGPALLDGLRAVLAANDVITDPDLVETHRHDRAPGLGAGHPLAVVRPRTTGQVAAVVRLAVEHGVPIVPRGAGSGLSGGSNAVEGALSVVLDRMDAIVEIDPVDGVAVVQPGVLNGRLRAAAREHGLWYAPDPASSEFCSIGGNVATNAGGLCCVKYGVTRDCVLALEVVLPDGSVTRLGHRSIKGVAGYDLTGLFVGSEGTLGLITEATVRLLPLPAPARTVVGVLPSLEAASAAVGTIVTAMRPSLLELLDRTTMRVVEEYRPLGLDTGAAALLIGQTDQPGEAGREEAVLLERAMREAGATEVVSSSDPAESELLLAARRLAYPAYERLGRLFLEDVAVPRGRLGELIARVEALSADGLTIGTFGHAGDGNLHPTVVARAGDEGALAAASAAFEAIMDAALELGGTVTGEHGVGLLKRGGLARELDAANRRLQRDIKRALDPRGLFNPGKALAAEPPRPRAPRP